MPKLRRRIDYARIGSVDVLDERDRLIEMMARWSSLLVGRAD